MWKIYINKKISCLLRYDRHSLKYKLFLLLLTIIIIIDNNNNNYYYKVKYYITINVSNLWINIFSSLLGLILLILIEDCFGHKYFIIRLNW